MMYTVSAWQREWNLFQMKKVHILLTHLTLQGTTTEQDNRFSDKEKKLLKQMKFGDCLSQRVSLFDLLSTHFYFYLYLERFWNNSDKKNHIFIC